jgi:hypothetical protein
VVLPETHYLVRSFEMVRNLVQGFEEVACDHFCVRLTMPE